MLVKKFANKRAQSSLNVCHDVMSRDTLKDGYFMLLYILISQYTGNLVLRRILDKHKGGVKTIKQRRVIQLQREKNLLFFIILFKKIPLTLSKKII